MDRQDYDDPKVEDRWCECQRATVADYLRREGVKHGGIGEWPAWHIAPYVAIWAIESRARPGAIGWWVISGDLPTDYISSADVETPQHPRKAMRVIAERWREQARAWKEGRDYEDTRLRPGPHSRQELTPLLAARAKILMKWVKDDSVWKDEENGAEQQNGEVDPI